MLSKKAEDMTMIEIARSLADAGLANEAITAYTAALHQGVLNPEDKLEAACAVLQFGCDYTVAYRAFLELTGEPSTHEDALCILRDAFYTPNMKLHKKRYENREDNLFKLGNRAQILHNDLAFLFGGEQSHKRRLDHRNESHVAVCSNGNRAKKPGSKCLCNQNSGRAVCAADNTNCGRFHRRESKEQSAKESSEYTKLRSRT